jgi:hypothetical protein
LLSIALELARVDPAYEDVATKFFEHFIYIADAINNLGHQGMSLWDKKDGFFYDVLHCPSGSFIPLKIRSFVGLIPLYAVATLEADSLANLPQFRRRMEWFIKYRPHLVENVASLSEPGRDGQRLLSLIKREQLESVMRRMLDPGEFFSEYGLRALSKRHGQKPYTFHVDGQSYSVQYEPGESSTGLFGGNSNWRGPIWFPVNYLMIESLQKYHRYYGDTLKVELPYGSGNWVALDAAAMEIARRLSRIFLRDEGNGNRRPVFGGETYFQSDPHWRDHVLFYEYFHGENGAGLGASHQTGWTALVATMLQQCGGTKS